MKRFIGVLLTVLAACGTAESSGPVLSAAGVYGLSTINNQPLPWVYQDSLRVYSGAIVLRVDSTFLDILKYDYVYAGLKATVTDTVNGQYQVTGSSIQFQTSNGRGQAGYDGNVITIGTSPVWIYRR